MAVVIPKGCLPDYIGYVCEPTPWHTITQEQVNAFADTTLDHQFIHVNKERAAQTPFGGTIAHGFLTLSMLAHFAETFSVVVEGFSMGMNYGFDKIRFLAPVRVGKAIRAQARIADITEKRPGRYLIHYDVSIDIQDEDKPALIAQWFAMIVVD